MFIVPDIAYDLRRGDWKTVKIHSLPHGQYELCVEIKADNYGVFFKCDGELGDDRNVWKVPIKIEPAHMRARD
jgi:hypothetical protein